MSEILNTSELVGYDWRYYLDGFTLSFGDTHPTKQSAHSNGFVSLGTNTRTGFQNPRWKDQCRLGSSATTTFSGQEFSGDTDRSYWEWYINAYRYWNSGSLNGTINGALSESGGGFILYPTKPNVIVAPSSVITDVHNRCIRKFIAEVVAAQSSENLTGRSIKHFKHDMHSLIHPMAGIQDKIGRYLTSLEKVSYGKLRGSSLTSTISSAYLEFRFGVAPFVDDITAIMTDAIIKERRRNPSVPVEATATSTYSGSTNVQGLSGTSCPLQPWINMTNTSSYSERMKGAVRTGINGDGRLGIIQDNRLLPKDWAPTIFSILPYAWMINYFTNIGDLIEAASFRFSDLVWCNWTTRTINKVAYGNVYFLTKEFSPTPGFSDIQVIESSGGNATFSYKAIQRQSLTPASLVPSFEFSIPRTPTPYLNMMAAFLPRINVVLNSFKYRNI